MRLHVHIAVGQLAKVNLRTRNAQAGHRALHRHIAQVKNRQPLRRKAVHRVHRDPVAVGINQLVVDPVSAAFGQLVHIQFAHRQHHLAQRSIDLVAVDVDAREGVVGTNFLHLAQRVLQRIHIPQADVFERGLIVLRIDGGDARFRGKLALRKAVQPVSVPRHRDIIGDVRPLLVELVRLHDERAHIPSGNRGHHVTDHRGSRRRNQPACSRLHHAADHRDSRAHCQRHRDKQHTDQRHVRIGVGHAVEDRVLPEQQIEAAHVFANGQCKQHKPAGDRNAAPGQGSGSAESSAQRASPARRD